VDPPEKNAFFPTRSSFKPFHFPTDFKKHTFFPVNRPIIGHIRFTTPTTTTTTTPKKKKKYKKEFQRRSSVEKNEQEKKTCLRNWGLKGGPRVAG
jgi:hypothetical protein